MLDPLSELSVASMCCMCNEFSYSLRSRKHNDVTGMHGCGFGVDRLRHHGLELWRDDTIFAGDHVPRRFCTPSWCGRRSTKCDFRNRTLSHCQGLLFSVRKILRKICEDAFVGKAQEA